MSRTAKKAPRREGQDNIQSDHFEELATDISVAPSPSSIRSGTPPPRHRFGFKFQGLLFKVEVLSDTEGIGAARTATLAKLILALLFTAMVASAAVLSTWLSHLRPPWEPDHRRTYLHQGSPEASQLPARALPLSLD